MPKDYFQSDEFLDVLNSYEAAEKNADALFLDMDDLIDISEYYLYEERVDDARKALERALQFYPEANEPRIAMARLIIHYDRDPAHAADYMPAMSYTDNPDYAEVAAEFFLVGNKPARANRILEKALEAQDEETREDAILFYASLFDYYGYYDFVREWLNKSRQTGEPEYKELEANIALSEGRYDEGEMIYDNLLDTDPYSVDYWNQMANLQFFKEDYAGSLESCEFALAIEPENVLATIGKAQALAQIGNHEAAITWYKKYQELDPDSPLGYIGMGALYIGNQQPEKALIYLRKAERNTDDKETRYDVLEDQARCHMLLKDYNNAFKVVRRMEKMKLGTKAERLLFEGSLLLDMEKIEESIATFEHAIRVAGEGRDAVRLCAAILLFSYGLKEKACEWAKPIIESENTKRRNDLLDDQKGGWAFMAALDAYRARRREFLLHLKKAVTLEPKEAALMLADLFPENLSVEEYHEYALEHKEIATVPGDDKDITDQTS